MSDHDRDSFKRRAADVFGALDDIRPPKKPRKGGQADLELPKFQLRTHGIHPPPSSINTTPPRPRDQGEERRGRERSPSSSSHSRHGDYRRHASSRHSDFLSPPPPRHHKDRGRERGEAKLSAPVPDFIKNPEKWKKYDLKNDGTAGMKALSSEQVNRAAAFQFLDEQQKRNRSEKSEQDTPADETIEPLDESTTLESGSTDTTVQVSLPSQGPVPIPHRVVFSKPKSHSEYQSSGRHGLQALQPIDGCADRLAITEKERTQDFIPGSNFGGAVRMPEYVVGSKMIHKRKRPKLVAMTEGEVEEEREEPLESKSRRTRKKKQPTLVIEEEEEDEDNSIGDKEVKPGSKMANSSRLSSVVRLSHLEEAD